MFCDLVGSTQLSQQIDAEELQDVIGRYQQAVAEAAHPFGGYVAKNLGDGLLIYFCWPLAHEDDPERAVRAGLSIVEALNGLLQSNGAPQHLDARIGIHTGLVVVDQDGEIFGDTPNIAARVQALAEPNCVLITEATHELIDGFDCENRGEHTLKGVTAPIAIFRVRNFSGANVRFSADPHSLTPFVGRGIELAMLEDRWESARAGRGQAVVIVGEAGVGKSRLLHELQSHLNDTPHLWFQCEGSAFTQATPFRPLLSLLTNVLGLRPEQSIEQNLARAQAVLGLSASKEMLAALPSILQLGESSHTGVSPDELRSGTVRLLIQWILHQSANAPVILAVEDLHWCDASTLEAIGRIIEQSAMARVLLLATTRPEIRLPWPGHSNTLSLQVPRLNEKQTRQMVQALCSKFSPPQSISQELVDSVVDRVDGVPLYIEELTSTLTSSDQTGDTDSIPATLADSLLARLDRFSSAKEIAQQASVLGREFTYGLLSGVSSVHDGPLRRGLEQLIDGEVLFVRGEPPTSSYTFKHALMHEAAYNSLLKRTRRQLHGRVVDALKSAAGHSASDMEILARHAELAGRIDEAVEAYQGAGDHARGRSAHEEAIQNFRHAIALLADKPSAPERDDREIAIQLSLGGSLASTRGFVHPDREAAFERARVLCEARGDLSRLGIALLGLANISFNRGDMERGRTLIESLLEEARRRGDERLQLSGHAQLALPEHYQGRFASSLSHCEAVRALYTAQNRDELAALAGDAGIAAATFAGWNLWALGYPDQGIKRLCDAVAMSRTAGHPFSLAFTLLFESVLRHLRNEVSEHHRAALECVQISRDQGFPLWINYGEVMLACVRVCEKDTAAIRDLDLALANAGSMDNKSGLPAIWSVAAHAYRVAGEYEKSRATVRSALEISVAGSQAFFDSELHRIEGEIGLDESVTGSNVVPGSVLTTSETKFRRAVEIARSQGARSFELRAATSLARVLRDRGEAAAGFALLAPVSDWFTEGEGVTDLISARTLRAELEPRRSVE